MIKYWFILLPQKYKLSEMLSKNRTILVRSSFLDSTKQDLRILCSNSKMLVELSTTQNNKELTCSVGQV